jgi:hypothetical protein
MGMSQRAQHLVHGRLDKWQLPRGARLQIQVRPEVSVQALQHQKDAGLVASGPSVRVVQHIQQLHDVRAALQGPHQAELPHRQAGHALLALLNAQPLQHHGAAGGQVRGSEAQRVRAAAAVLQARVQ